LRAPIEAGFKASAMIVGLNSNEGVDFINILRALFALIFWRQKLQSWVLGLKFFAAKTSAKKVRVKC